MTEVDLCYLVIGAVALGLHGYPRATVDLDILCDMSSENLERLIEAMDTLGFQTKLPVDVNDLCVPEIRNDWISGNNISSFPFYHPTNRDNLIFLLIDSPINFEDSFATREIVTIQGVDVPIASPQVLLQMKQASSREKDKADVVVLQELIKRKSTCT